MRSRVDAPRSRIHGPLATPEAITNEPAPFSRTTREAPLETGFADWRHRLTANLSRRSDGRWAPLTWAHANAPVADETVDEDRAPRARLTVDAAPTTRRVRRDEELDACATDATS
jgi:hypothetical protein